jgi:hypothetical protein
MPAIISIFTFFGLLLNFAGAVVLALNAYVNRQKVLELSRQRVPVVSTVERQEKGFQQAYDKAIERMPDVQYRLLQSKNALIGLILLTIGFLLQLPSVVTTIFYV